MHLILHENIDIAGVSIHFCSSFELFEPLEDRKYIRDRYIQELILVYTFWNRVYRQRTLS